LPPGADGATRHVKTIDEELVPISKTGLREGVLVSIISGRHDGLFATITKILPGTKVLLRLESSEEEVMVDSADLQLVDKGKLCTNHPALHMVQDSNNTNQTKPQQKRKEIEDKRLSNQQKTWLYPNIIVRIISKSLANGKYYLKKATVDDVISGTLCTVQLLETKRLLDIDQSMLETVIPKPGTMVMVVEGSDRKKVGSVVEKKKDEAVVQLKEDLSLHSYNLDSISEYVGDIMD